MALQVKTQVISQVVNTTTGINIALQQTFIDAASCTINPNFTTSTYELVAASDWVQLSKADMGSIRDVYIVLNSCPQTEAIGVIITCADTNAGCLDPQFCMRETFVATTCIPAADDIYVKNFNACCAATLTVVLGGDNV